MIYENELYHHGILGQKWGIRRYQNEDGTLTEAGKKRYAKYDAKAKDQAREYTKNVALRNYTRLSDEFKNDPAASLVDDINESNVQYSYSQGQKIVSKMIKKGLVGKETKFEDYIYKHEKEIVDKYLKDFDDMIKKTEGHNPTEQDYEWMYYIFSQKDKGGN